MSLIDDRKLPLSFEEIQRKLLKKKARKRKYKNQIKNLVSKMQREEERKVTKRILANDRKVYETLQEIKNGNFISS